MRICKALLCVVAVFAAAMIVTACAGHDNGTQRRARPLLESSIANAQTTADGAAQAALEAKKMSLGNAGDIEVLRRQEIATAKTAAEALATAHRAEVRLGVVEAKADGASKAVAPLSPLLPLAKVEQEKLDAAAKVKAEADAAAAQAAVDQREAHIRALAAIEEQRLRAAAAAAAAATPVPPAKGGP